MGFVYVLGFIVCIFQSLGAMVCSSQVPESVLTAQVDCQLAQMPERVLKKIAGFLPSLSDVAHTRQTCKFFNYTFKTLKIRLGPLRHSKNDIEYWAGIYSHIIQLIKASSLTHPAVPLDLSGNSVERFMFAKYAECVSVKKLRLVLCRITGERDNFFDPHVWANLEKLDLSRNCLGKRDKDIDSSVDWDSGADIWPSLLSLPKLKKLILRENQLCRVPPELYAFTHLEYIDLRGNPLAAEEIQRFALGLPKASIKI